MGNLSKFISIKNIEQYDKINFLGHMTLYKNTKEINRRFMIKTKSGIELSEILGTDKSMAFDELNKYSINTIYRENKFKEKIIFNLFSDVSPNYYYFREATYDMNYKFSYNDKRYVYLWNEGSLFKCYIMNSEVVMEEIGYAHFQKRKLTYMTDCNKINNYIIIPNKIIDGNRYVVDTKFIKKHTRNRLYLMRYKLYAKEKIRKIKLKLRSKYS